MCQTRRVLYQKTPGSAAHAHSLTFALICMGKKTRDRALSQTPCKRDGELPSLICPHLFGHVTPWSRTPAVRVNIVKSPVHIAHTRTVCVTVALVAVTNGGGSACVLDWGLGSRHRARDGGCDGRSGWVCCCISLAALLQRLR